MQTAPAHALPDTAFVIDWDLSRVPSSLKAGDSVSVSVGIRNRSSSVWPDPATADTKATGAYAVRLGYRWLDASGILPIKDYSSRVDLTKPLAPGESAQLIIDLAVPKTPGAYQLQLDLVQELVAWFEWKGASKAIVSVKVLR